MSEKWIKSKLDENRVKRKFESLRLDRLETVDTDSGSEIDASSAEDWIAAFPHSKHVLNILKETDDDEPDTDPELTPLPTAAECAIARRQRMCVQADPKKVLQPDPKKVKLSLPIVVIDDDSE